MRRLMLDSGGEQGGRSAGLLADRGDRGQPGPRRRRAGGTGARGATRSWCLVGMLLAGCGVDPSTEALVGVWANLDAGTWRVFQFGGPVEQEALVGLSDVYEVSSYPEGAAAVPVQAGTYVVEEDRLVTVQGVDEVADYVLVTRVVWSADGQGLGAEYGNAILGLTADRQTLQSDSAASGERVYDRVEAAP